MYLQCVYACLYLYIPSASGQVQGKPQKTITPIICISHREVALILYGLIEEFEHGGGL